MISSALVRTAVAAVLAALALPMAAAAQSPSDVPAGHWARSSVMSVVRRGVMTAAKGRFQGTGRVTRREMAITLARYARALEAGKWSTRDPLPKRKPRAGTVAGDHKPITRYDLADSLDRLALYAARGLPRSTGKVYAKSEALAPVTVRNVARTDPAYSSLQYLARGRMLAHNSVLLKPGSQPVTQLEAAQALAMVVVGVNDRLTQPPPEAPALGPAPNHQHPEDAPARKTAPGRPPARPGSRA